MGYCRPLIITEQKLIGSRRTGVTLEQRPVDANGMEEITGIFSSPRKPSPLKNMVVMESVDEAGMSWL